MRISRKKFRKCFEIFVSRHGLGRDSRWNRSVFLALRHKRRETYNCSPNTTSLYS